ncbi:bZIP transcription factor 11-like [Lycium ferocissimum]|uniref:bZIP transcription factor 11-like n=1 Tax=Lycium ferocissimum TaxID=112874 RepID=UPI0028159F17|nr:bZIP transcription factor 11-like [Lycium ferocissimum]
MASSSGTSSGSSFLQNSGSEEDLQQLMDQRKRKRMISNRESARRSRMRKQKHLDDLMAQVATLRKENNQILTSMNVTTQHYLNVEAENSILRAQLGELSHRLESLNEIIAFLDANNNCNGLAVDHNEPYSFNFAQNDSMVDGFNMTNSWNYHCGNQPIMTADVLQY